MPLDQVVGHDHARRILGAPLRHVASNAIGRGGVLAGALQGSMALPADCRIVVGGFLAARRPMWVVTGLARQPACARGKTPGLTQPVYGTYRLEFVVVSRSGRMIERNYEI